MANAKSSRENTLFRPMLQQSYRLIRFTLEPYNFTVFQDFVFTYSEEISPLDLGQKGFNKTFNANVAYMIFGRDVRN